MDAIYEIESFSKTIIVMFVKLVLTVVFVKYDHILILLSPIATRWLQTVCFIDLQSAVRQIYINYFSIYVKAYVAPILTSYILFFINVHD